MGIKRIFKLPVEYSEQTQSVIDKIKEFDSVKQVLPNIEIDRVLEGGSSATVVTGRGNEYVVRVNENEMEPSFWEKAIGKNFDHVVEVFYAKEMKIGDGYNNIVVMEKLEPIDKTLFNFLSDIQTLQRLILAYQGTNGKEKYIKTLMKKHRNEHLTFQEQRYYDKNFDKIMKLVGDYVRGMEELKTIGMDYNDYHEQNIMYDPKTKNYKIIDLEVYVAE